MTGRYFGYSVLYLFIPIFYQVYPQGLKKMDILIRSTEAIFFGYYLSKLLNKKNLFDFIKIEIIRHNCG